MTDTELRRRTNTPVVINLAGNASSWAKRNHLLNSVGSVSCHCRDLLDLRASPLFTTHNACVITPRARRCLTDAHGHALHKGETCFFNESHFLSGSTPPPTFPPAPPPHPSRTLVQVRLPVDVSLDLDARNFFFSNFKLYLRISLMTSTNLFMPLEKFQRIHELIHSPNDGEEHLVHAGKVKL